MWFPQTGGAPAPCAAAVTQSGGGYLSASGEADFRGVPLFQPFGVCGVPCEGSEVLLLPLEGGAVCAGALCPPEAAAGLAQGELRLYARGGASIVLKNTGDVVINGLTVTKNGTILEKGALA